MPIAAIPLIAAAAISAGGSIAGGLIGSSGAKSAAQTQADAAQKAQQLIAQQQQQALGSEQGIWNQIQGYNAPWQQMGLGAAGNLSSLMGLTPGSTGTLMQPWTGQFQAPTAEQAAQTPGYQFALQQGLDAMQNSAAARGNLLTGGTMKALNNYAQGMASTNYQQTYNNAFQNYLQNYNQFQTGQANQYQRLFGLMGMGQTATGELTSAGPGMSQAMAQTLMSGANAQANQMANRGAALASGTAGATNAYSGMASGLGNLGWMMYAMQNGQQLPSTAAGNYSSYNAPDLGGIGNVMSNFLPGPVAQGQAPAPNLSGYSSMPGYAPGQWAGLGGYLNSMAGVG
jgi:hypothetical protein